MVIFAFNDNRESGHCLCTLAWGWCALLEGRKWKNCCKILVVLLTCAGRSVGQSKWQFSFFFEWQWQKQMNECEGEREGR